MRGTWGERLELSIFGESHGEALGMVINGLPVGYEIDLTAIAADMARRAPGRDPTATARREADVVQVVSGLTGGRTNGAPLCGMIQNTNTRGADYEALRRLMRPGHADYPSALKYKGFADVRGGGHFSGRLTAPLVFAGALARQILRTQAVEVGAHIAAIAGVEDAALDPVDMEADTLRALQKRPFPVLDEAKEAPMRQAVLSAKERGDSVGGTIECGAVGLPVGLGEPFFGSVESVIASLLFSIPAVKAVGFGEGPGFARMTGSQANDAYLPGGTPLRTATNHNGGILGGLTNGMPLRVDVTIKPTPSIALPQQTVDLQTGEAAELRVQGRHDPCIVPRAVPVVEAAVLLGILELALQEGWI